MVIPVKQRTFRQFLLVLYYCKVAGRDFYNVAVFGLCNSSAGISTVPYYAFFVERIVIIWDDNRWRHCCYGADFFRAICKFVFSSSQMTAIAAPVIHPAYGTNHYVSAPTYGSIGQYASLNALDKCICRYTVNDFVVTQNILIKEHFNGFAFGNAFLKPAVKHFAERYSLDTECRPAMVEHE